ncbi:hypothetical protein [Glutamicibacter protophormiae]|uniref:hypothetical protein n=1 Tax=Glutamicibacter protophormiae TaxID=37930 RepID=UPI003A90C1FD
MSKVNPQEDFGNIADGLVQLRFADEAGKVKDISASEMAESLQGLVEFTNQLSKTGMFGTGLAPEVRVRPAQEGSFILEAMLQWGSENPEAWGALHSTASGLFVQAVNVGFKRLRSETYTDYEYLDNGNVKVLWRDSTPDELPMKTWDTLRKMKRPTKRALRKIMAPLGDDVDRLEFRDASVRKTTQEILSTNAEVVAVRSDYRIAAAEEDEVETFIETFEAEAQLESIDFRPGEKWQVKTLHGKRKALVVDEDFLRDLDKGMALHKNDIFSVTICETRTVKNGRTSREWELVKVARKKRGDTDDSDGTSRESTE